MSDLANSNSKVIDYDLNCVGCEYNLKALPTEHLCPECGRDIKDSLPTRTRLSRAKQQWLQTVSRGLTFLMLATVMSLCSVIGMVLLIFSGSLGGFIPFMSSGPTTIGKTLALILLIALMLSFMPFIISIWLITASRPRRKSRRLSGQVELAARIFSVFGSVSLCLAMFPGVTGFSEHFLLPAIGIKTWVLLSAALIATVLSLSNVADHLNEKSLSSQGRIWVCIFGPSVIGSILCASVDMVRIAVILILVQLFVLVWLAIHISILKSKVRSALGEQITARPT